jgi:hypothetical protein
MRMHVAGTPAVASCVLSVMLSGGGQRRAWCPLHVVRCALSAARCPLRDVCCTMSAARCLPHDFGCTLSAARCRLHVVGCVLSAARCLLCAIKCRHGGSVPLANVCVELRLLVEQPRHAGDGADVPLADRPVRRKRSEI